MCDYLKSSLLRTQLFSYSIAVTYAKQKNIFIQGLILSDFSLSHFPMSKNKKHMVASSINTQIPAALKIELYNTRKFQIAFHIKIYFDN